MMCKNKEQNIKVHHKRDEIKGLKAKKKGKKAKHERQFVWYTSSNQTPLLNNFFI